MTFKISDSGRVKAYFVPVSRYTPLRREAKMLMGDCSFLISGP